MGPVSSKGSVPGMCNFTIKFGVYYDSIAIKANPRNNINLRFRQASVFIFSLSMGLTTGSFTVPPKSSAGLYNGFFRVLKRSQLTFIRVSISFSEGSVKLHNSVHLVFNLPGHHPLHPRHRGGRRHQNTWCSCRLQRRWRRRLVLRRLALRAARLLHLTRGVYAFSDICAFWDGHHSSLAGASHLPLAAQAAGSPSSA